MTDARRYSRLPFASASRLVEPKTGRGQETRLIDISLKGALVEQPPGGQPAVGDPLQLEIHLEDSDITIRMDVKVAHIHHGRIGLNCLSIDLDSMTHLRRLMELNLGDPGLLERELFALE